jgi:hypothetical protein
MIPSYVAVECSVDNSYLYISFPSRITKCNCETGECLASIPLDTDDSILLRWIVLSSDGQILIAIVHNRICIIETNSFEIINFWEFCDENCDYEEGPLSISSDGRYIADYWNVFEAKSLNAK